LRLIIVILKGVLAPQPHVDALVMSKLLMTASSDKSEGMEKKVFFPTSPANLLLFTTPELTL
jgi:hypothetical protein